MMLGNGVVPAGISFSLLDNCVGQNKSKVVLMFFAMQSVVFPYKNIADRVVAWCRNAVRKISIFSPCELICEMNKVKSIDAVFLDHESPECIFHWYGIAAVQVVHPPPAGYTANYLFEIDEGVCTTVNTPDKDAITFRMIDPTLIAELFGSNVKSIWEASIRGVELPRHPVKELPEKKMKLLVAKYFSIPQQYLSYYPCRVGHDRIITFG
ncbi:hypothetical protein PHMEG_00014342 [Phytophthora megakarya]|uniref:Uncharacterized protein n=1 Tax=Phytophthora megakarya TaxID=4795 RepID=A0A225W641_9STRA|nr:hypothetical protein PHMEG_00014342 [Phytophthora megakarya]